MIIKHPTSGTHRTILGPLHRLWVFLFAPFYYASKGMWGLAVLSLFIHYFTLIVFPLWNRTFIRTYYESLGWRVYEDLDEFFFKDPSNINNINLVEK